MFFLRLMYSGVISEPALSSLYFRNVLIMRRSLLGVLSRILSTMLDGSSSSTSIISSKSSSSSMYLSSGSVMILMMSSLSSVLSSAKTSTLISLGRDRKSTTIRCRSNSLLMSTSISAISTSSCLSSSSLHLKYFLSSRSWNIFSSDSS